MAIVKRADTSHAYSETTQNGTPSFTITRRIAFDKGYDLSEYSDLQEVKASVAADCWTVFVTASDAHELGRMRLRALSLTPVAGTAGKIFDVTARYDSMYTWTPLKSLDASYTNKLALPVEVDADSSPRMVSMYRSPSFTTNPAADTSTTTDIGGTKVDYGERPVAAIVSAVKFRVSMVFDSSRTTLVSLYDRVATHQGRWNSAAFLHWATAGQVYCESANISHIRDEYYRVSYVFVWDQWYGAEQVPKVEASGTTARDSNGSATTVTWKNIVRGNIDHNLIFNDQPDSVLAKQIALEGSWLTYP